MGVDMGAESDILVASRESARDETKERKMNIESIAKHVASVSPEARKDMSAGQWDEVMADALYAACGAENAEEMAEARSIAKEEAAKTDYSEYLVGVTREASYYSRNISDESAEQIQFDVSRLIEGQFPGILCSGEAVGVTGPNPAVCAQIQDWIYENWQSAL